MLMQANALTQAMIDNDWLFPAAECVHIASFALAIGTIALVDLSLLGVGLQRKAAAQITRGTGLWTLTGLVLIIFTGLLLFASDPDMYLRNSSFTYATHPFGLRLLASCWLSSTTTRFIAR